MYCDQLILSKKEHMGIALCRTHLRTERRRSFSVYKYCLYTKYFSVLSSPTLLNKICYERNCTECTIPETKTLAKITRMAEATEQETNEIPAPKDEKAETRQLHKNPADN